MTTIETTATRFLKYLNGVINPIFISVNELAEILEKTTQSTFCHIIYFVDESGSVTKNGKKTLQKLVQCRSVALNHNYTNKVVNLSGETDFKAYERKGVTHIGGALIQSEKSGEYMIDGKILKINQNNTIERISFFYNDEPISELEAIANNLFTNSYLNPKPQTTMGRGAVSENDNFSIIQPYLKRIQFIKLAGQWYGIADK